MKHKPNSKGQAETTADSCKIAENLMSIQPISNAPVACCVVNLVVHKHFLDVLFFPLQTLFFLFYLPQFSPIRYLSKTECHQGCTYVRIVQSCL